MVTIPGEPSTQVGYDLRQSLVDAGHSDPWVLGLVNDYMAYFTTKEEYKQGHYDSCSSLFGWKGAKRIQARYLEMLGTKELQQASAITNAR